ncbi:uroporphyrinogen-III synthase [Arhodomonas sp. SL1]|uniref:uroporphyrinogen-III synthase n=1 Tax=Arhodomonas sp. SL1 TaxID=3425691 RepID=UPI003F8854F1
MSRALEGVGVVVTRPQGRTHALAAALRAEGAQALELPTIDLTPLDDAAAQARVEAALAAADWAVFVSPGGVEVALERFGSRGIARPEGVRIAAVGPGTAAALRLRGWPVDASPAAGGGAAELLETADFAPRPGASCVILAGEHGRDVLAEGLADRGVRVTRLAVYRAMIPTVDPAAAIQGWRQGRLQYTIVTSVTGLEHLRRLLGPSGWAAACNSRMVTVSARVADRGRALGIDTAAVAADPGDEGIVQALRRAVDAS